MNAAFLIMSSAVLAGADPVPPPPPPAAPVVVNGAGCGNCGAPACCEKKPGLLDRIKGRLGHFGRKSNDCGCAPACAPAPVPCCKPAPPPPPPPCNACPGPCDRPNLLDKVKAWCGTRKSHKGPSCCQPACCDPCAPGVVPAPGPGPGTPPKEMPKPKDEKPKGGNTGTPQPLPGTSTGLTGSGSPY